ncbi:MAG: lycopene cyclase domain-containing protein [Aquiluna sp.]|jgi:lycopene cyclase domain-containing protein|uniref:lycopene cyclase domain-containing protein n=1 Tax=Aquiluna sp. TaxID=2053504 RepID=UPI002768EDEC|nr:lycopene cyclase domain-containing protein [Aquiluna sp.]
MSYPLLTIVVLGIFAVYAFLMRRWLSLKPLTFAALVMFTLTAIFDNVIIGTGIVAYDDDLLLGIKILYAPIEDFAYTAVAVVLVPSLFNLFRTKL